jgi:hypothetical protein
MRFLNSSRVLQNMNLLASHVLQTRETGKFNHKRDFIEAINVIQKTSFANNLTAKVEFDNQNIVNFLVRNGVFNENEIIGNANIIPFNERSIIESSINDALSLIRKTNVNLFNLFHSIIGSIAVHSIPERDGGSISNGIGLIWLSPLKSWDSKYYGEMLVHELIHNCVFLEDMVRGIMPNTDLLGIDDALSISAIRQTRRPFDKSFHSACVVSGIMYYYTQIGDPEKAMQFLPSFRNTLGDLKESYEKLAKNGQYVLSQNGCEILNEMYSFSKELEYSVFENSLA